MTATELHEALASINSRILNVERTVGIVQQAREVKRLVMAHFGNAMMQRQDNLPEGVYHRYIAFYLIRKHTELSLSGIAGMFIRKGKPLHHTSILAGIEKITHQLTWDEKLQATIAAIEREITK